MERLAQILNKEPIAIASRITSEPTVKVSVSITVYMFLFTYVVHVYITLHIQREYCFITKQEG